MTVLQGFFYAYLASAVASDVFGRRIPNWLTLGGTFIALGIRAATGGWGAANSGLIAALIAGAIGFVFWFGGTIGGGDHKLLIGVGAFLGRGLVIFALLGTALAGGILALVWLLFLKLRLIKTKKMPYSIAIAAGALGAPLVARVLH